MKLDDLQVLYTELYMMSKTVGLDQQFDIKAIHQIGEQVVDVITGLEKSGLVDSETGELLMPKILGVSNVLGMPIQEYLDM